MRDRLLPVAEAYRDEGRHPQAEFIEHIMRSVEDVDFSRSHYHIHDALEAVGVHRRNCACPKGGRND